MPDINETVATVVAEDEQPAVVTIYKSDGDPYLAADGSEATMSILGAESKKVRAAKDKAVRRFVRRRGRDEIETARQNRIDIATAAVVAWHGWYGPDGVDVPLTPENIEKVLRLEQILEQVEDAIRDHARFFKPRSAS